jgi:hypothetical protein
LEVFTVAHSTWHEKSLQPHFAVIAVIDPPAKPDNIKQYCRLGRAILFALPAQQ